MTGLLFGASRGGRGRVGPAFARDAVVERLENLFLRRGVDALRADRTQKGQCLCWCEGRLAPLLGRAGKAVRDEPSGEHHACSTHSRSTMNENRTARLGHEADEEPHLLD